MKEIAQTASKDAIAKPFPWRVSLPDQRVIPCFCSVDFAPRLAPLPPQNTVDVAVGTFRSDLVAPKPEILGSVSPSDLSQLSHANSLSGESKLKLAHTQLASRS